jgi:hypothetical protein
MEVEHHRSRLEAQAPVSYGAAKLGATSNPVRRCLDMEDHPDVLLGSTPTESGLIEVLVTGTDVRLTVSRDRQEDVVVFLAPDCASNLRDLLDQALQV